jgi:multimeric flavodoxin WrbA
MKILALNGSPRGRRSNTDRLLLPFLEGAREGGAEIVGFYLEEQDIQPCKGCFTCWLRTPGRCVQDDDMRSVLPEMLEADAIIWAFPLYCFGVPARMQAVQERMLPLVMPHFVSVGDAHGHPPRYPGKKRKYVVLSNCGLPEKEHFDAVVRKFTQLARAAGDAELIEPIVMAAGELLPYMEKNASMQQVLAAIQDEFRSAGRELAESGTLARATVERLSRPLTERVGISAKAYARAANAYFESELGKGASERENPADS